MKQLRILMLARPDLLGYPGGDTTQVLQTAAALRQRGVAVDVNPSCPRYENYDLLHFFNIIDPEDIIGHLQRTNRPYIVSTVYCLYDEFDRLYRRDAVGWAYRFLSRDGVEYLKTVGKWLLKGNPLSSYAFLWRGHRRSIQRILKGAACLLPNSESEYRRLLQDYGVGRPYVVVPNGVNLAQYSAPAAGNPSRVLCVSRIEGRKNQLNLIRALNHTGLEVYLVGRPADNQKRYYEECRRIAAANIHFTGYVSSAQLREHYRSARVHVLPSWFETTGLSSLEAALMGCNVVVGDRGDVREYFRDDAWYCEPAEPDSIREAVLQAYEAPLNTALAERIRKDYHWEAAARQTLKGYELALNTKLSATYD